jgi:L-threonylcarbamoyladenylate synthase
VAIIISYPVPNIADIPIPPVTKESLVVFPTETVYGIGAFISNTEGIEEIYSMKGRDNKPLTLHLCDPADIYKYAAEVSEPAKRAISLYLPGPLMMIFKAAPGLSLPERLLLNGKIGVRVFSNFIGASLINMVKEPMAATSANLSGGKSPKNFYEVPQSIIDGCDYAFDNGATLYQKESTIIDFSGGEPLLLREGALCFDELKKVLCVNIGRL